MDTHGYIKEKKPQIYFTYCRDAHSKDIRPIRQNHTCCQAHPAVELKFYFPNTTPQGVGRSSVVWTGFPLVLGRASDADLHETFVH